MMMMMMMMMSRYCPFWLSWQAAVELEGWTKKRLVQRVLDILRDLELIVCADMLVGCPGTHARMHARKHTYTHVRAHAIMRTQTAPTHIRTCIRLAHTYTRMDRHTHTRARAHLHTYTHMRARTHIGLHTRTQTHTHTLTHTHS